MNTGLEKAKVFPTARISFDKQIVILQAYAAAAGPNGKAVSNKEVAALVKMTSETVSLSNAFFSNIGLILKVDGGYIPAPEVVHFQLAHQWNPEKAGHKLAPIIERAWFTQRLLPKLRMGPLDKIAAIADLAEVASAPPKYGPQMTLLLDYMEFAGIVQQDNTGMYMVTGLVGSREAIPVPDPPIMTQTIVRPASWTPSFAPTEGVIQFQVSVKVSMAELSGWSADRITAFFGGVAQVMAAKGKIEGEG
jgi:hypothetical protein